MVVYSDPPSPGPAQIQKLYVSNVWLICLIYLLCFDNVLGVWVLFDFSHNPFTTDTSCGKNHVYYKMHDACI